MLEKSELNIICKKRKKRHLKELTPDERTTIAHKVLVEKYSQIDVANESQVPRSLV